MKKRIPRILMIIIAVGLSLACSLPGLTTPTMEPESTQPMLAVDPTATETALPIPEPTATDPPPPDPTATETLPTAEPTDSPASMGQIAYTFNGNIWRYIIDTSQIFQVTTDGIADDYLNTYRWPRFSPDGRYLAYNRGNSSFILDLVTDTLTEISAYGQFFAWTGQGTQFFAVQGDFECPDLDNLEDQVLINFDILSLDLTDLADSTLLGNIGGGLSYLQAISNDGEYASILHCGCYSECGSERLWHLSTLSPVLSPDSLFTGNIAFSPNGAQLTVSQQQLFGYYQSPLFVANSNYSEMVEVFSMPNVAPIDMKWSPNGDWIAFTGVVFINEEGLEDVDRCVRMVKPDGSQQVLVDCDFADFITWSPDGTYLIYRKFSFTQHEYFIYHLETGVITPLPIQPDPYIPRSVDWGRLP